MSQAQVTFAIVSAFYYLRLPSIRVEIGMQQVATRMSGLILDEELLLLFVISSTAMVWLDAC